MKHAREVNTCSRCRQSKRRCDKAKPSCIRCERGGNECIYEEDQATIRNETSTTASDLSSSPYPTPATTPPTPARKVRKRNRVWLSCNRCHRLKVKCDQGEPCARCTRSGVQADCAYTHRRKHPPQDSEQRDEQPEQRCDQQLYQNVPFAVTEDDSELVVATWFLRKRGSTLYNPILNRMEMLSSLQATPFAIAVKQHMESRCSSDFSLPSNYPFGSPESARYMSMQKIHELVQTSRPNVSILLAGYFESFHPSLPIFDKMVFEAKLVDFWEHPKTVNLTWLAQFLAVLGLGAYAIEERPGTLNHSKYTAAEFLYAAEACLSQTTYMARPTTTAISTLCLMVVAKQATVASCWTLDTCWNVMGTIIRLSMMMVLNREWMPGYADPVIVRERALRRRLWTMIVYLDTQMSARTGQQSMLPQGAFNLNVSILTHGDCWDTIMPRSLPIICGFLSRMNAHDGEIYTYEEVLEYDREINQLMREAMAFYEGDIVEFTLDIFFRRILLAVHCQYALRPKASINYPVSYNSTFEVNLALLNHYHRLSSLSPHTQLLAQPYMLDFLSAALTTCMLLLSPDELSANPLSNDDSGLAYRQTMLDALMRCMDILANDNRNVLCFTTGFKQLEAMYALAVKDNPNRLAMP